LGEAPTGFIRTEEPIDERKKRRLIEIALIDIFPGFRDPDLMTRLSTSQAKVEAQGSRY
jgi:hypothetical protein